ncbi:hypothetical protein F4810DRAFT_675882 [Camillea tinctor]|nr:hypothetical protein F4810DRAFT_675882 [Camillea tinctor]
MQPNNSRRADTITRCINVITDKNMVYIGPAFRNIRGKLYPAVSFATERPGAAITANFGSDSDIEFQYKNWESDENTIDQMITEGEKSNVFHGLDSDGDLEWELLRLSR